MTSFLCKCNNNSKFLPISPLLLMLYVLLYYCASFCTESASDITYIISGKIDLLSEMSTFSMFKNNRRMFLRLLKFTMGRTNNAANEASIGE